MTRETNQPIRSRRWSRTGFRARGARAVLPFAAALLAAAVPLLAEPAPAAAAASHDSAPHAAPTPRAIDRYVRTYLAETGLPGATVTVTKGNRTLYAAGYGHTADGARMTKRTPVPIASMSKSFTALAVLQLVEAGKVDLDRPVRRYLPEFRMADPRAARITVRQVLDQTSGMADSTHPELRLPPAHSLSDAVAKLRPARLADTPGTAWNYHNPNYALAARLVEVVSGLPYPDYLSRHVLRPLGMVHTRTAATTDAMPEHARGYVRAFGTVVERAHPHWFTGGAYDVVTTAGDLGRWLALQNGDGRTRQGRRLVSARSLATMHTPPRGPGAPRHDTYAMGWSQREGPGPLRIEHGGELLTQNSFQVLLPGSGYGIAVTSNTGMNSGDDSVNLADGLVRLVQGEQPKVTAPFSSTSDPVLGALSLLALALAALGVRRAGGWAARMRGRRPWRVALRLLPYTVPLVLLGTAADLFGLLMNRSGTLWQLTYVWPGLAVWLAANALASGALLTARTAALLRSRSARAGTEAGAKARAKARPRRSNSAGGAVR